ncbi:MAG: hypothetical protein JJU05_18525 [Verrucomicrobia bacterium]|nr:hypothetical protein [Verrucomicrobiota bacterium]MCH8529139.1 DUF6508 domain-containing protein [Kiritimatiellia bacterium]
MKMEDDNYEPSRITEKGIDALLIFLPYFRNINTCFGTQPDTIDMTVLPSAFTEQSTAFYKACYDHNFVQDFDWGKWSQSKQGLINKGLGTEELNLADIGRLLTAHFRRDRFCDGHLLKVMQSGQIARILDRLLVIRGESTKYSRAPKLLGDFGEGLASYVLIRKNYEVAQVDHVGADLIAEKDGNRYAVSVKTRLFRPGSVESLGFVVEYSHVQKLNYFSNKFNLTPLLAIILSIADEKTIHLIFIPVEKLSEFPQVKNGISIRFSKSTRIKILDLPFISHSYWKDEEICNRNFT